MSWQHLLLLAFVWSPFDFAAAQEQGESNEQSRIERDGTTGLLRYSWWGKRGRTYFLQHSEDMLRWEYLPIIESGDNSATERAFTSDGGGYFLRLKYTDEATSDPEGADFDGDGVKNFTELLQGTDPFEWTDSDVDGLPDDWEQYVINSGLTDQDGDGDVDLDDVSALADFDGDGLTNSEEYALGTEPVLADTDGDSVDDLLDGIPLDPDLSPRRLPETRYAVIDLSSWGEVGELRPAGPLERYAPLLNDKGQVLLQRGGNHLEASYVLWEAGVALPVPDLISALALNNHGQVAGILKAEGKHHAAFWKAPAGSATKLPAYRYVVPFIDPETSRYHLAIGGGETFVVDDLGASAINDLGVVVGMTSTGHLSSGNVDYRVWTSGASWSGGTPAPLGPVVMSRTEHTPVSTGTDADLCVPFAINNLGEVVGSVGNSEADHGSAYSPLFYDGTITRLPITGSRGSAVAITTTTPRVVVGRQESDGAAFLWVRIGGQWKAKSFGAGDADPSRSGFAVGSPTDINNRLEAIARHGISSTDGQGRTLWRNGRLHSLDQLVPATWMHVAPTEINNHGVIAAHAGKVLYQADGTPQTGPGGETKVEFRPVLLLPVEIGSEDRMFHGTIRLPDSWTDVGLQIVNTTTSQDFGTYPNILASSPSFKVYDSFDEIFTEEELEGTIDTSQKIVFVRDEDDPQKVIFFGISDQVGEIRIKLLKGSEELGYVSINLTEEADMSDLIGHVDTRIDSLELPAVQEDPPPQSEGSGSPQMMMIGAPMMAMSFGGPEGSSSPEVPEPIEHRNLTTKAMIPFYKSGLFYRVGPFLARNRIEAAFTKGFIDGAWTAGQQNLETLEDFRELLDEPKKRAGEIFNGLMVFAGMSGDEVAQMLVHTYYGFLNEAERELQFNFQAEVLDGRSELNAYAMGYAVAYGIEQFVLGTAAGAGLKVTGNTFKGVLNISKSENLVGGTIAVGRRFKARYVRFAAEHVTESDLLDHLARQAERLGNNLEIDGKIGTQLMEEALDARNATQINMSKITAETNAALKTLDPDLNFHSQGKAYWFLERQAAFVSGMGAALTEKGWLGFIRVYQRLINEGAPNGPADRVDDLMTLFNAQGQDGKIALNQSLEAFKDASEGAAQGAQVKFFAKGMDGVFTDIYHHVSGDNFGRVQEMNGKFVLSAYSGNRGWYVTPDRFDDQAEAFSKLQLFDLGSARYRLKLRTTEVKDNVKVPYAANNERDYFEPVTRVDPGETGGSGGARQLLLENISAEVVEVYDTAVGRALTNEEISQLLGQ